MGKRKRAPSPINDHFQSSTNSLKLRASENKKDVITITEGNENVVKQESLDKASPSNTADTEVPSDDRPIPQLRISARVQNKQRREEHKEHSSIGQGKKADGNSQDEEEEEEKKISGTEEGLNNNGELKKRRRAWELWSLEDKNTFFEAINECGKDFEAIQNFLVTKLRKKGIPSCVIKNKDQVRHFYYRTWHKISKHIKFDDDVKKSTQELYTLINYGELRRKIGGTLDEKKGQKLQELIQKGSTSVRIKGKTVRVKTPICRALKKLNEFPDEREQAGVRLPSTVNVEIVPANIRSWNHVQSVAHNPRVRVSCSMNKTVGSVIEHLQTKWRCTKFKICDSLIASANFPVEGALPPPMTLRLRPPRFTDYNNVSLKIDAQVKSFAVSLSSHSQMLLRKGELEQNTKVKVSKTSRKKKGSLPTEDCLKGKIPEEMPEEAETKEDHQEDTMKESAPEDRLADLKIKENCKDDFQKVKTPEVVEMKENNIEGTRNKFPESVVHDVKMEDIQDCVPNEKMLEEVEIQENHKNDSLEVNIVEEMEMKEDHIAIDREEKCDQEENVEEGDKMEEEELITTNSCDDLCNKEEDVVFLSCHSPKRFPAVASTSVISYTSDDSVSLSPSYEEEVLNAVKNIKEEIDPMETIHQLMALENVANTQEIDDDADVICIGERTKLSAQLDDTQKKLEEQTTVINSELEELKSPTHENVPACDETYLNFSQSIEKAKKGWTVKSCGVTTIGELYLMFGKNQQISLEYDFVELESEEEVNVVAVDDSGCNKLEDNTMACIGDDHKENRLNSMISTASSDLSPPLRPSTSQASLSVESSSLSPPVMRPLALDGEGSSVSTENISGVESVNKKAAENISSMLAKLIYMVKIINSKGPVECLCGNIIPSKSTLNNLKSPNPRHFNGLFKSPGNTKSPRGCSLSMRSPRTPSASAMSPRDGVTTPVKAEKSKPASAKRLIPEYKNEQKISFTSSGNSMPGTSKDKMMDTKRDSSAGVNSKDLPTSTGGEFRVPNAPAPRNAPNQIFNAQLSKLLPRYSRPTIRRTLRKNMVVQRQLPLMPHQPKTSQGFVAVKVGSLQEFNINTAPQISLPIAVGLTSNTLNTLTSNSGINQISTSEVQQTLPSILIQQQPSPASMPIIAGSFIGSASDDSNSISVNVSGHQLLTVKMPSYPVSSHVTTVSTVSSITHSSTASLASLDAVTTTTTCALPLMSEVPVVKVYQNNTTFSNLISQNFADAAYLTTPPSTPMQFDILNTPSISKEELNCYNENSNSSFISISDIEVNPLSTPMSTPVKANIAPPVSFAESSLLQTPIHNSDSRIQNKNSVTDISPIKLNLSTFLSSPNTVLNRTHIDDCQTDSEDIPQIHIPECGDNLPMLDISIGGTISLKEGSTNIVSNIPVTSIVDGISSIPSIGGNHPAASIVDVISHIPSMPSMSSFLNDNTSVSEAQSILPRVSQVSSTGVASITSIVDMPAVSVSSVVNSVMSSPRMETILPEDQQRGVSTNIDSVITQVQETINLQQGQSMMNHVSQGQTLVGSLPLESPVMGTMPHVSAAESVAGSSLSEQQVKLSMPDTTEKQIGISLSVTCVTTSVTPSIGSSSERENSHTESMLAMNTFQDTNDKIMDISLSNSNSNSCFTSFLNAAANQPCLDSVMENSLLQTPPRPLLSGGLNCGTKSNLSFDGEGFEPLTGVPLSPPSSPSRLLRHTEAQWINNENEFSLSSLLGSMESSSPIKGGQPPTMAPPISQSPQIRALFTTISDNSVDFTATFASFKNQTKDRESSE